MDPGLIYHVFTHVVYAHIHKLYCIQCRAAQFGTHGCMSRSSVECKKYSEICLGTSVACTPPLLRVPAKSQVTVIEIAITYKKGLAACIFFSRAAVITDCALQVVFFHKVF